MGTTAATDTGTPVLRQQTIRFAALSAAATPTGPNRSGFAFAWSLTGAVRVFNHVLREEQNQAGELTDTASHALKVHADAADPRVLHALTAGWQ
ncbi:hypothetical protein [Amycolatopsis sp. NPDC049868]|uniref:hypothetical protein n=1 Tax=Amycolatopsis sp. NPDC049868 TaxID=3363934 RepID=UPI00379214E4